MRNVFNQTTHVLVASLLGVAPLLWFQSAKAAQITSRSVTIGSSVPGAVTTHRFNYNYPSVSSVGSLVFEYCSNSPQVGAPCTAPGGLNLSGVSLVEPGYGVHGSSTSNKLILTRAPSMTIVGPEVHTFNNVTNQSTANQTVFVRISSYASIDGTGAYIDEGSVAYSTASPLSVSGYVPPYLTFCVGVVVALDCSNVTGTLLSFGELSKSQPRFLSSQFSVATNDPGGHAVSVTGTTMTSGNNVITALASPQPSQPGTSQFGMNLRANSNPAVGANPAGVGTAVISPNFAIPNQFYFNNQVVASSSISTDFNSFTVSYLINVPSTQPAGFYSTTLTYIAVAAF